MNHTLFSWSLARSLQLAFDALSEEETILKQGLAHVQMSQKHHSFSRSKIPVETQDLAVQKKGTTCQKALVAEGLGEETWGIFCNRQHLPGLLLCDFFLQVTISWVKECSKGCLCVACWQSSAAARESQCSPWAAFPKQEGFRWPHIPRAAPLPPVPAGP